MTPSESIAAFIRAHERFRPNSYRDKGGTLKIGYGHSGCAQVDLCSIEEAEDWLRRDIAAAGDAVTRSIRVPLNQNQFDALTSFVFDIGPGVFEECSVAGLLNRRNYDEAAVVMLCWGTKDTKTAARRAAEVELLQKEPSA